MTTSPTKTREAAAAGAMLAAALDYALSGMPVLPLDGKVPRNSNGLTGASTDVGVVASWDARWPGTNFGIRTGAESGIVVLDVDAQNGGAKTLAELERRHGKLPRPHVLTGGGGTHYYFKHPGKEVRSSAGKLGHGIDIRGDGGYVVAPPALHKSGRPYKLLRPLSEFEPLPAWLLEDTKERQNGTAPPVGDVIPEGHRRAAMLTVAGKLRRSGLTGNEILPTLRELNGRCQPPLEESEIRELALDIGRRYQPNPEDAIRTLPAVKPADRRCTQSLRPADAPARPRPRIGHLRHCRREPC
jgi:hypothetical protein